MIYYHHRITKFTKCLIRIFEISLPPQEKQGAGGGLAWETGRAQSSYTNPAMTDWLKSPLLKFISACSSGGATEQPGGQDVIGRTEGKSSLLPLPPALCKQEIRVPSSTQNIYVATVNDEFLHFGNGQSESSHTIYRNFEMENTWSVLLKKNARNTFLRG